MTLPLDLTHCNYQARLFTKAYEKWYMYRNLYEKKFQRPAEFQGLKIPVFATDISAEIINQNKSTIKIFIILSEGISGIVNNKVAVLPDLKSDCLYVFITGDDFCAEDYPLYNRQGEKISYVNICFPWFLYELSPVDLFDPTYNYSIESKNKFYDFRSNKAVDFVSIVGTGRLERIYFLKKIQKVIDNNRFAVSLNGNIRGQSKIFDKDFVFNWHNTDRYDKTKFKKLALCDSVPVDLFNQAHINIIVETQIIHDSVDNFFVTEKTTKALFTGIPFIVYGSKNFLANLRKLGFMTYNSLWSEDYDSLPTYRERADAIVALMQNLLNFDWETAIPELERIHYHNLRLLSNRNKIITPAFENFDRRMQEIISTHDSTDT